MENNYRPVSSWRTHPVFDRRSGYEQSVNTKVADTTRLSEPLNQKYTTCQAWLIPREMRVTGTPDTWIAQLQHYNSRVNQIRRRDGRPMRQMWKQDRNPFTRKF